MAKHPTGSTMSTGAPTPSDRNSPTIGPMARSCSTTRIPSSRWRTSIGRRFRSASRTRRVPERTRTLSETRGFLKALIAADSDRILGFTALGVQAGELIAVVQTAMLAGAPYTALRDAILTHPTIAEGLTVLFAGEPTPPPRRIDGDRVRDGRCHTRHRDLAPSRRWIRR